MPYILYKTNGAVLTTVQDATLDTTTDLTFIGRNYSGYGQPVDENFLKLLENFSNRTAPPKPIMGQLWFDSNQDTRRLKVCVDGKNFKGLAALQVQDTPPDSAIKGDLWWDSANAQLRAYDGSEFKLIGPSTSQANDAKWTYRSEQNNLYPTIRAEIKGKPFAVFANLGSLEKLIPDADSDLSVDFRNGIRSGITLAGCDSSGATVNENNAYPYYFWGTASDALKARTAENITVTNSSASGVHFVPFVSTTSGVTQLITTSSFFINPDTNVLNVTATAARYADLAERYEADTFYDVGTVLIVGGDKEVTESTQRNDPRIAGIVSLNPAYAMNTQAGNSDTHPYVALKGRVPCKVVGHIRKGDLLISSETAGCATAYDATCDSTLGIIGIALEDYAGDTVPGIIEVKV